MSLGEDARQDMYCDEAEENALRSGRLWKTKTGEVIPICEMTDEHLLNAQRLMDENKHWSMSDVLFEEIEKRGLNPLPDRSKITS